LSVALWRRVATGLPVRLVLPAGVIALWGGLYEAMCRFPSEFDWRYMTLSRLLSPRDNPAGYHWAVAAIEGCGLAIALWSSLLVALTRNSSATRSRGSPWSIRRGERFHAPQGIRILQWGSIAMMASALVPLHMARLPKLHELLTIVAFLGLCLGLVRITQPRIHRRANSRIGPQQGGQARPTSLISAFSSGALAAPVALAGLAQAYIFFARPDLHWVGLVWRTRGVPVYLSFAFWEWLTCGVLTLYLLACGAIEPRNRGNT
jgi:hypothetical protein